MKNDMHIFDLNAVRRNRERAMRRDANFLHDWCLGNVKERLAVIKREFDTALISGARDSFNHEKIGHTIHLDLSQKTLPAQNAHPAHLICDEETLPLRMNSADALIDILSLHTKNDLPGTLIQINRALKPDGLFIGTLFGGETLFELRKSLTHAEMQCRNGARPRVYPFVDKQQMGALMQRAGFALPVIDSELITVSYSDMFSLMRDVRHMGEASALHDRTKSFTGRDIFMTAAEYYHNTFAETDGRIPATFEIIFVLGWSPHESQQQPLKPGSAEVRLADLLNTTEITTGEKAKP